MTIFYFTATGNSLFVAKQIADHAGAKLVSIPQVITEQKTYSDDCIGFIYPQYAIGLPKMVRSFILNNTFSADYIFAVDLYAYLHAGALRELAGIIKLNYGTYLKTPGNFVFLFGAPKNPTAVLDKTKKRLDSIINDIANRARKPIKPKNGIGIATKYFGETNFRVADICRKRGTCVNVCPANNIQLDGKIRFGSKCETCFSCINLCPAHAIYSNIAPLKRRQYRNPVISVSEIAEANGRTDEMEV